MVAGAYEDGELQTIFPQTQPCVICGAPSAILRDGLPVHKNCWIETSTATTPPSEAPSQDNPAPVVPESAPMTAASQPTAVEQVADARNAAKGLPAAVFTRDGVWFGDHKFLPLPPIRHIGDIARAAVTLGLKTVYQTTTVKEYSKAGQAWISDDLAEDLGFHVTELRNTPKTDTVKVTKMCAELTRSAPGLTEAIRAGVKVYVQDDGLRPFTLVRLPKSGFVISETDDNNTTEIHIVLMAAVQDIHSVPELALSDPKDKESAPISPAQLAKRLTLFADAARIPYFASPMVTATEHMYAARGNSKHGRAVEFASLDPDKCPPALISRMEDDNHWFRKPMSHEAEHTWVHAYDRSASYLAGVAGIELGIGNPMHFPQGRDFIKKPGYWLIDVATDIDDWRQPPPLDPQQRFRGNRCWVTTPSLAYAIERGQTPTIHEAYLWFDHARILQPWRDQLAKARTTLDVDDVDAQAARNLVKYEYTRGIGYLQHKARDGARQKFYRPDWGHHTIANSRVNIGRQINKIGETSDRWPIAVTIDMILYTSNEPDPIKAWPGDPNKLGNKPGDFKPAATGLLAHMPELLDGTGFTSEDAVKKSLKAATQGDK